MTPQEMSLIVARCQYPDYELIVCADPSLDHGAAYLLAAYREEDVDTGRVEGQTTRRWLLTPQMTPSEIVQTAFKCVLTSAEHRVREHFRYQGQAIFGPHFDVDDLLMLCEEGRRACGGRVKGTI